MRWLAFRLLLRKEWVVRGRGAGALVAALWAAGVMMLLYAVRVNIDDEDFPTCEFPARALPSAGALTFLQSFVCAADNECRPLGDYPDIPNYDNSTVSKLARELSPFTEPAPLRTAARAPAALQVAAALARAVDEPTFIHIAKHGLSVRELFSSPARAQRRLGRALNLTAQAVEAVMDAHIGFGGLLNGSLDRCSAASLSGVLQTNDTAALEALAARLCAMASEELQAAALELMPELAFGKYLNMIGEIFRQLDGSELALQLARAAAAGARLIAPGALTPLRGPYLGAHWLTRIMNLLEPTYGDTEWYKSARGFTDALVVGAQYIGTVFGSDDEGAPEIGGANGTDVGAILKRATLMIKKTIDNKSGSDIVEAIAQLATLAQNLVPSESAHDVALYGTLLAKLLESAGAALKAARALPEGALKAVGRHPAAARALASLPPSLLADGLDAFADPKRVQLLTSKLSNTRQMFCDEDRIKKFFGVESAQAQLVKEKLCTDEFGAFSHDLIEQFGIYRVKDDINWMASLLIAETLGRDISSQLSPLGRPVRALGALVGPSAPAGPPAGPGQWAAVFNVTEDSEFMNTMKMKAGRVNEILITIHITLAREIVHSNIVLSLRAAPVLGRIATLTKALAQALDAPALTVGTGLRENYDGILDMLLETAMDEEKSLLSLSTPGLTPVCLAANASVYWVAPRAGPLRALCEAARALEGQLTEDSAIGKAIAELRDSDPVPFGEVKWTELANDLKQIYLKITHDYPFISSPLSYGADSAVQQKRRAHFDKVVEYWFGDDSQARGLPLCVTLGLRVLDVVDTLGVANTGVGVAGVTGGAGLWVRARSTAVSLVAPLNIAVNVVRIVTAAYTGSAPPLAGPPLPAAAALPVLPILLAEVAHRIRADDADLSAVIAVLSTPSWPCSNVSLSSALSLTTTGDTLRQYERLACADAALKGQWGVYLETENNTVYNTNGTINSSTPAHPWLVVSNSAQSLYRAVTALAVALQEHALSDDWRKVAVEAIMELWRDEPAVRKFLQKLDTVVTSWPVEPAYATLPLGAIWRRYGGCAGAECGGLARAAARQTMQFVSLSLASVAGDLLTYFNEIQDPKSSPLSVAGFLPGTPLGLAATHTPRLAAALLASYYDLGFMIQIRRATQTQFWDCEGVVEALAPAALGAPRARLAPYLCPSFLFWLSLPRGDNVFVDVVAKPQYYLFKLEAQNLTSNFSDAFEKLTALRTLLPKLSEAPIIDLSLPTLRKKLDSTLNTTLNYQIDANDEDYREFSNTSLPQFVANVYLTRVTAMVNKIAEIVDNVSPDDVTNGTEEARQKINADKENLQKMFKRKPNDALALHFDVFTNMLSKNGSLVESVREFCSAHARNDSTRALLGGVRAARHLCAVDYSVLYEAAHAQIEDDYTAARDSLDHLVQILRGENVTDVVLFLQGQKDFIAYFSRSIQYSYELGIPVYVQYLGATARAQGVAASLLAGEDWWAGLKELYTGPLATALIDVAEKSIEIATDFAKNVDKIQLVQVIQSAWSGRETMCAGAGLGTLLPDATGALGRYWAAHCATGQRDLFREIPPLLYASQIYDKSLRGPKGVNYTELYNYLDETESRVTFIGSAPRQPRRPSWVTEGALEELRNAAKELLERDGLIKLAFGAAINLVDASTLYLNKTECPDCSWLTSWAKQATLQLYSSAEWGALLCRARGMHLEDLYQELRRDFHWNMALDELLSARNYTIPETRRALTELLRTAAPVAARAQTPCLDNNGTGVLAAGANVLDGISRFIRISRAALSHVHESETARASKGLRLLKDAIAQRLRVRRPLAALLQPDAVAKLEGLAPDVAAGLMAGMVELPTYYDKNASLQAKLPDTNWSMVCAARDCAPLLAAVGSGLDRNIIDKMLPTFQEADFYHLTFLTRPLRHVERAFAAAARMLAVFRDAPLGEPLGVVDTALLVIREEVLGEIVDSLSSLTTELSPLLSDTALGAELGALTEGMGALKELRARVNDMEMKVPIRRFWPDAARAQAALRAAGLTDDAFWRDSAPKIADSYIDLKPLLNSTRGLRWFVCSSEGRHSLVPGAAEAAALCDVTPDQALRITRALMDTMDFGAVVDTIKDVFLPVIWRAAGLSTTEGDDLAASLPDLGALLQKARPALARVAPVLANEPFIKALANFTSVEALLSSGSALSLAGPMMCGRALRLDAGRLARAALQAPDLSKHSEQDDEHIAAMPTEFCRSLYRSVSAAPGGKVMWAVARPLLAGRLLYTPPTPPVLAVIKEVNTTFEQVIQLADLIRRASTASPALTELRAHSSALSALRAVLTHPAVRGVVGIGGLEGEGGGLDFDVEGVLDSIDIEMVSGFLSRGAALSQCVKLDRLEAAVDERALARRAAALARVHDFSAGLVFEKGADGALQYKIRMDIENVPTTTRLHNFLLVPGPEASFVEHLRYYRGFVQAQDLVAAALLRRAAPQDPPPAFYTRQEPYPCYKKDYYQTSIYESQALLVAFFFSMLFLVASVVRLAVADKESGNAMLLGAMCGCGTERTLAWAAAALGEALLAAAAVGAVLVGGGVLPRSAPTLVFALLAIFAVSLLSFCYLMSKLFSAASVGAVVAGIGYMLTFLPFVVILSLEAIISSAQKLLVCLSMSSAICYSFLVVTRLEASGEGAQWAHVWGGGALDEGSAGVDNSAIAMGAAMTLFDSLLYFVIGWLIEKYFGIKSVSTCVSHVAADPSKAGVSVVEVSRRFGARAALKDVSLELRRGGVTALLGHNGAGKTTLINILTGALRPTSGHVIVRGAGAGGGVGVCPQRDVLYGQLSAAEHVELYAQLKAGRALRHVRADVDAVLRALALGAVAHEPVRALSGGTRRRVAVALAFVGAPHLVTLDEPTAGVDPAARQDIWALIVKLREGRTILLTTHHLDEAELLSDQVVIMHRGAVHTTGAPVDIRRALGDGYRLHVQWAPSPKTAPRAPGAQAAQEAVKAVVPNATVLLSSDTQLEMALPFYDHHGLSNNFVSVCQTLEARQQELGFAHYMLDCCTLEEVFQGICTSVDDPDQPEDKQLVKQNGVHKPENKAAVKELCVDVASPSGPLSGSARAQLAALLLAQYTHYKRNRWLLFLLVGVPALFVALAMAFSTVRPPADNERVLRLRPDLYGNTTQYIVPYPWGSSANSSLAARPYPWGSSANSSLAARPYPWGSSSNSSLAARPYPWGSSSNSSLAARPYPWGSSSNSSLAARPYPWGSSSNSSLAARALRLLASGAREWEPKDTPTCECGEARQVCVGGLTGARPALLSAPDIDTLKTWIVSSQDQYREHRYMGYSSAPPSPYGAPRLVAWYNNKGHHALPAALAALHGAALRAAGAPVVPAVYSHPLKISKEQLNKDTIYQHVADAGISALVLLAYCLVSAGAAVYAVGMRARRELALLAGTPPWVLQLAGLLADMAIICINVAISMVIFSAFGFPVFVARSNLLGAAILLLLYGAACSAFVQLVARAFTEPSMANMVLFCGNTFLGLSGLAVLMVLDIIAESEETEYARWLLHKLWLLSPQFALGDGLLEIAKNTIQAQVLDRFGLDTYRDPVTSDLLQLHYLALAGVFVALVMIQVALDAGLGRWLVERLRALRPGAPPPADELEPLDVALERRRVMAAAAAAAEPELRLRTIGNINAGYVDTENSPKCPIPLGDPLYDGDVAAAAGLRKEYPGVRGRRVALHGLALGLPAAEVTALLGQNGAGKSTTFKMLTGATRPSAGRVLLRGRPAAPAALRAGVVSYCPQADALDLLLTVRETLDYYCRLRGERPRAEAVERALTAFGLRRYAAARCGALSGGWRRAVCAAVALGGRSALVLLDEPTSGMDPTARARLGGAVRAAIGARRAALLATHALGDARALASRVALLRAGRLVAVTPLAEALRAHGAGLVLAVRAARRGAQHAWRRLAEGAPRAQLRVLHAHALHAHVPLGGGEAEGEATRLSEVFALLAALQAAGDIEDYAVNQSSLDQMFLSYAERDEPAAAVTAKTAVPEAEGPARDVTPL